MLLQQLDNASGAARKSSSPKLSLLHNVLACGDASNSWRTVMHELHRYAMALDKHAMAHTMNTMARHRGSVHLAQFSLWPNSLCVANVYTETSPF